MKYGALLLIFFSSLMGALPAHASVFEGGEHYSLPTRMIIDDNLYIAGGTMALAGSIIGDVLGLGGNVLTTGDVREDLFLAGGTLDILGNVGGDVRALGGKVTLGKSVGGDVLIGGGVVTILDDAIIGKDVVITGGAITMNGVVEQDVHLIGGEIRLNGIVQGDVTITAQEALIIDPETLIGGMLTYSAPTEIILPDGVALGGVTYKGPQGKELSSRNLGGITGTLFMLRFMLILIAALAVTLFFGRITKTIVSQALSSVQKSFAQGVVAFVVTPVSIFLLFATFVGIILGGALMFFFGFLIVMAKVYSAIILGAWVWRYASREEGTPLLDWRVTLLGVFLLSTSMLIPVIGWVVGFVSWCVALGALAKTAYTHCVAPRE